jgi:RHS repeat-associated protein
MQAARKFDESNLIAEADGATGASTREYIWLPANDNANDTLAEDVLGAANLQPSGLTRGDNAVDLPLAVINVAATPVIYHVHSDHLGRPVRMTDAAKSSVWSAIYKPWGEVQSVTGTAVQNLRFPGQYFLIETGLAYNWHRHYDPATGRYTQPDPLRFVDGPSVYAYAGNSPWMRTDRDGRETWTAGANGNLVIGGGAEVSAGVLFNLGDPTTGQCADFGLYLGGGTAVGLGIGVGVNAGYSSGPASSVDGVSLTGSVGVGPVTVQGSISPGNGSYGAGLGVGVPVVSATMGANYTNSFTYQKAKSLLYSMMGWGSSSCGCKR